MSFDSRAYRILIASPSDVEDEREIAVRVIQEWNDLHSYTRKVVLLPLRWETHTAPEYGTRPQEVINRAIVDECDLLIGIFWTRIGSPTGVAESGSLEEIERVAKAGKPVMLYFSKLGADPGSLNLDQVAKLNQFKEKTYPQALTESYKSIIEFRDKFAKQLELKIRELQRSDSAGPPALQLSFLNPKTADLHGSRMKVVGKLPVLSDFDEFANSGNAEKKAAFKSIVSERISESVAVPAVLAVHNATSFGVRNLYADIAIKADQSGVKIARSLSRSTFGSMETLFLSSDWGLVEPSPLEADINQKIARLEKEGLSEEGDGWKLSFEWGALQPQRTRVVKPVMFVTSQRSTLVDFRARFYADGFPHPLDLQAQLEIVIEPIAATVKELIPNIDTLINEGSKRSKTATIKVQ